MKVELTIKREFEVKYLQVEAGVRYWEDATVNGTEDETGKLIPCRSGGNWCPLINLETGKILNWVEGTKAEIHYKVCDDGRYRLLDDNQMLVKEIDGYVPKIMSPKENGYGDYIIMDVDETGTIANWKPILDAFTDEDED